MTIKETTIRIGDYIYRAKNHFGRVSVFVTEIRNGVEFHVIDAVINTELQMSAIATVSREVQS